MRRCCWLPAVPGAGNEEVTSCFPEGMELGGGIQMMPSYRLCFLQPKVQRVCSCLAAWGAMKVSSWGERLVQAPNAPCPRTLSQ